MLEQIVVRHGLTGHPPKDFRATVAVTDTNMNPMESFGHLHITSPPEIIWSMFLGFKGLLASSPSAEEVLLAQRAIRTFPVTFELKARGLDMFWSSQDSRESLVGIGDAVRRSATQRYFVVMESKFNLEQAVPGQNMGAKKITQYWLENVNLAPSSEKVTESFVDACFTTGARLMSNPSTQALCVKADAEGKTPLDSIYKYDATVKRAQTFELIHWCTAGLIDIVSAKMSTPGELSLRQLIGRGLLGGKGVLDMLIAKHEMAKGIHAKFTDMGVDAITLTRIEKWCTGHDEYRAMNKDQLWLTGAKNSSKLSLLV